MNLYEQLITNGKRLHPLDICKRLNQIIEKVSKECNFIERFDIKIKISRVK